MLVSLCILHGINLVRGAVIYLSVWNWLLHVNEELKIWMHD